MTTITLYTAERQLILLRAPVIASGDRERVRLEVHTDESWIGYRLTAILFRDGERENACELPLDLEHICILPPALLAEPCTLQIGLRGLIDDPDTDADAACRTTSLVRLRVAEGTPAEAGETLVNPTDATADENAVLAGETFYAGGGKAARTGNIPTYEEGTPTILTPYTETDPTVPAWAKKPNPPTPAEIGAAPAGFGLGKRTSETQTDNPAVVDTWFNNGWYGYYNTGVSLIPNYSHGFYGSIRVDAGKYGYRQTFIPRFEAQYSLVRSSSNDGAWTEWEWVNPPMQLGVEYRTTERYKGKPLYVKAVDCGELPVGTTKAIEYGDSQCRALFCYGECGGVTIPTMNFGGYLESTFLSSAVISLWCNLNTLYLACGGDRSGLSTTVIVKYWKTTD